jgi:hypothetical protein
LIGSACSSAYSILKGFVRRSEVCSYSLAEFLVTGGYEETDVR